MGRESPQPSTGGGHFVAAGIELADRVESLSLQKPSARGSQDRPRVHFEEQSSESTTATALSAEENGHTATPVPSSDTENDREAEQASTSGRGRDSNHRHSPSWEEKGKVRAPYRLRYCQASVVHSSLRSPAAVLTRAMEVSTRC